LQQHTQHWQQQHQQQHTTPGLLSVEPVGLTQQHEQQQQQHWSRQLLAHGLTFVAHGHSAAAAAVGIAEVPTHALYQGLRLHVSDATPGQHFVHVQAGHLPCNTQHGGSSSSSSSGGFHTSTRKSSSSAIHLAARGLAPDIEQPANGDRPAAAATAAPGSLRQLQQVQPSDAPTVHAPAVGIACGTSYSSDVQQDSANRSTSSSKHDRADGSNSSSSSRRRSVSSRHGDPALSRPQRLLRGAFYVWVNVMNLVCISSLWARCADAFTPEVS
jgi:hypothetical protein